MDRVLDGEPTVQIWFWENQTSGQLGLASWACSRQRALQISSVQPVLTLFCFGHSAQTVLQFAFVG